jgi:hypothetical protein
MFMRKVSFSCYLSEDIASPFPSMLTLTFRSFMFQHIDTIHLELSDKALASLGSIFVHQLKDMSPCFHVLNKLIL